MKDHLRIIGDVHGFIGRGSNHQRNRGRNYLNVAGAAEHSVQIGDMGFDYSELNKLDPLCHAFFGGNHDNYDIIKDCPYNLGDYGLTSVGGVQFFYCRGAYSIDYEWRVANQAGWWMEEQLSYRDAGRALDAYEEAKPDIMLTHTCPNSIAKLIGNPAVLRNFGLEPDTFTTLTQNLLQNMFEVHQPKLWVYGHFHQDRVDVVDGTQFICLDELSHLSLDKDGEIA